jgi:hypothetical protein
VYARTTSVEIDTVRVSVDEALAAFENLVAPRLECQEGFQGIYVLATPEGRGLLVSFWETSEQADASGATGWYAEVLADFMTMFRSAPGREHYEVRFVIPPRHADPPSG